MKVEYFDIEEIRYLMMMSDALEAGVEYYMHLDRRLTRSQAEECAIVDAQNTCKDIWYNDRTGYINNERKAFERFEELVDKGHKFYTEKSGRCPYCRSTNIRERTKGEKALTFGLVGVFALATAGHKHYCESCKKTF